MRLIVVTTLKCNLKCKHCIYDCPKYETLEYPKFEEIFLKLLPYKVEYVSFSGGEAILNSDFQKMVELVYKHNTYFMITSNALWYEKYLPIVQKYRNRIISFHFSIDGMRETHDMIRTKGSFDKVIEAIVFYQMIGVKIVVNLTLNKFNYNEFEEIIKLFSNLKIYGIKVGAVIPTTLNKKFQVSFEKRKKVYDQIENWSKKYNMKIVNTTSLFVLDKVAFCPNISNQDINLNPKGELTFCCDIPGSYGKLGNTKNGVAFILENKIKLGEKIKKDRVKKLKDSGKTCEYCQKYFNVF